MDVSEAEVWLKDSSVKGMCLTAVKYKGVRFKQKLGQTPGPQLYQQGC